MSACPHTGNPDKCSCCLRVCCMDHRDRFCQLNKNHDGHHRDDKGNEWMQHDWETG